MLSDLARLFEHVDDLFAELRIRMGGVVCVDQLRQTQRTGHARRPAADDHNIGRHLRTFNTFERSAEKKHVFKVSRFQGFGVLDFKVLFTNGIFL